MKRFKGIKGMIILLIMAALILGYYLYISNRNKPFQETEPAATAVQEVLLRNLENNYPPSPKEVLKYYCEITQCFYNETYTDEELHRLASKIRELLDAELVANQTDEDYYASLQFDINDFKDKEYIISSFATSASTDVDYYSKNEFEYAKMNCTFTIRQKTAMKPIIEKFVFRKDEDGHWKILGWDLADVMIDE